MKGSVVLFWIALLGLGGLQSAVWHGEAEACALHSSMPTLEGDTRRERGAEKDQDSEEDGASGQREVQKKKYEYTFGVSTRSRTLQFGTTAQGRAQLDERMVLLEAGVRRKGAYGLGLALPIASRTLARPDGGTEGLQGPGDLSVEGSYELSSRWQSPLYLDLRVGVLMPLRGLEQRDDGPYFHPDVQLGAGVFIPRVGAIAGVSIGENLQGFLGADFVWAPESPDGVQRSATLRVQPSLRYEIQEWFDFQLGLPMRHEGSSRTSGEVEAFSGGTLVAVEPQLIFSFYHQLNLRVGGFLPVFQDLRGGARESASLFAGIGFRGDL